MAARSLSVGHNYAHWEHLEMRTRFRFAPAVAVLMVFSSAAQAALYNVSILGDGTAAAYGISDNGQAVGASYPAGCCGGIGTIWNGTSSTFLSGGGGYPNSLVQSINNVGQSAGYSWGSGQVATVWNGTVPIALGYLLGSNYSNAFAINNAGQVVGTSYSGGLSNGVATIWNGVIPTALSNLPGASTSGAFGINNFGQAVGVSSLGRFELRNSLEGQYSLRSQSYRQRNEQHSAKH